MFLLYQMKIFFHSRENSLSLSFFFFLPSLSSSYSLSLFPCDSVFALFLLPHANTLIQQLDNVKSSCDFAACLGNLVFGTRSVSATQNIHKNTPTEESHDVWMVKLSHECCLSLKVILHVGWGFLLEHLHSHHRERLHWQQTWRSATNKMYAYT